MMNEDELYDFMFNTTLDDLVVTFTDGYKYRLVHLTLSPSFGPSGEIEVAPIFAETEDCLNPPDSFKQAIKEKLVKYPHVSDGDEIYTIWYKPEEVQSIFREYDEYCFYQK